MLLAKDSGAVDVKAADVTTALIYAVASGHVPILKLLQQYGADVNTEANDNMTALMVASMHRRVDAAAFLIKAGINVNAVDSERRSALTAAVEQNCAAIVQLLLDHGADINDFDESGKNNLFRATCAGHVPIMRLLVQRGLSATAADSSGNTLLMSAAAKGHTAAAAWLLQQGVAVNAASTDGLTALHYANMHTSDDAAMIELLLANGADVHKLAHTQITALDVAVEHGKLECAKVLIAAGTDVNNTNFAGYQTLHTAIMKQHAAVVQLLLEHGAVAVLNSVVPIGCSNGAQCCTQATALMTSRNVAITKVLLAAGADVHVTTDAGGTCLHDAARHKYKAPVICLLIKAGVDLHAVNHKGKTATQIAHDKGYLLTEQLLNRAAQQQEQ
jgi:uncharacterized protein